jgi:hypothetical protein
MEKIIAMEELVKILKLFFGFMKNSLFSSNNNRQEDSLQGGNIVHCWTSSIRQQLHKSEKIFQRVY